jgi:AhpD family alkylhydroperoxidase
MDATKFRIPAALTAVENTTALSEREKHLIGLAVVLTRGCQACTGRRLKAAAEIGISTETLQALIDLTAGVNAGVTLRTAIEGARIGGYLADAAACEGAECAVGIQR